MTLLLPQQNSCGQNLSNFAVNKRLTQKTCIYQSLRLTPLLPGDLLALQTGVLGTPLYKGCPRMFEGAPSSSVSPLSPEPHMRISSFINFLSLQVKILFQSTFQNLRRLWWPELCQTLEQSVPGAEGGSAEGACALSLHGPISSSQAWGRSEAEFGAAWTGLLVPWACCSQL